MKIRKSTPEDIVVDNELLLIGDDSTPYVMIVEEVLNPADEWKAFTAQDGCRYGHRNLWVVEHSINSNRDFTKVESAMLHNNQLVRLVGCIQAFLKQEGMTKEYQQFEDEVKK